MPRFTPLDFGAPGSSETPPDRDGLRLDASGGCREPNEAETKVEAAMHAYIERTGRRFPTWSEALEVLRELGGPNSGARTA